jgi:hypothetical protein
VRQPPTQQTPHQSWFDFTDVCKLLRVADIDVTARTATGPGGWQRFNPDFVYRYRRLPDATTVNRLVSIARAYGIAAQRWRWT